MDENKEMWERLTKAEQSVKSAHHRLDGIENLTESVRDMVIEVKHMREDLNDVRSEVDEIRAKPAQTYNLIVKTIIAAVTSGLVGYVLCYFFGE